MFDLRFLTASIAAPLLGVFILGILCVPPVPDRRGNFPILSRPTAQDAAAGDAAAAAQNRGREQRLTASSFESGSSPADPSRGCSSTSNAVPSTMLKLLVLFSHSPRSRLLLLSWSRWCCCSATSAALLAVAVAVVVPTAQQPSTPTGSYRIRAVPSFPPDPLRRSSSLT